VSSHHHHDDDCDHDKHHHHDGDCDHHGGGVIIVTGDETAPPDFRLRRYSEAWYRNHAGAAAHRFFDLEGLPAAGQLAAGGAPSPAVELAARVLRANRDLLEVEAGSGPWQLEAVRVPADRVAVRAAPVEDAAGPPITFLFDARGMLREIRRIHPPRA
jgi:hypothetical protein